ncbi:hypothetical protein L1N85_11415 [Paenibacillus alkaliterrae]|uniref:hypothetical protein n=1 Tax=Paenibacillus alkaliterrae TaxID=320909 RepID=UPI001F330E48|nr:hypothetical protein [Paenibacillus alkaliterrae]MCF2939045.1 hypothetical protein [Paenibacillus alkaliterrae]
MVPNDIVLGDGVFAVGGVNIALTRGGGQFLVEREYRRIQADGDYGPVKGRIRKISSVAKLVMNALEILPASLPKFYPSVRNTNAAGPPITDTITGKVDIETADYNTTVTWTGKTKGGRNVVITLDNAINLENIDWALTDKDELVPQLTFTATYDETTRTTEPWKIVFSG